MQSRAAVMNAIKKLAKSRANDAVKLAFIQESDLESLEDLDLSAVTEFKRSSNGTVEVKLVDRLAALQWLAERVGGDPQAAELYEALEKGAEGQNEAL